VNYKDMPLGVITIGLIIYIAFLVKDANRKKTKGAYFLVLAGGVVIFLFEPIMDVLLGDSDGASLIVYFGLYFIVWAIIQLVKLKKAKPVN
jgi:hypothetical protein